MNKFFIDDNGAFYYGDQPDDVETRRATDEEVGAHLLNAAKQSKLSDIRRLNLIRQISDDRRTELETAVNTAATIEEVDAVI